MKKRVKVRSQIEFDACIAAGNVAIVIGCRVVARENASVEAWGNASVVARENASVEAWGNASVVAWGNASVEARGNASVVARENASVVARENASVEARGNASVEAWGNASVVARENASVVARENASVEAWGSVFVRLFSALKIKASAHVAIMIHGPAKEVEGGKQMQAAPEPTTGAEWCDYYGIDRAKAPFVVPNLDAAILASIERHKDTNGLRMSSWHGSACDETNWCNTTHCRAGYAICLAGKAGFDLERKYGSEKAGAMIYAASRPDKPIPNFHATDADAMADIMACAAEQSAVQP